MQRTIFFVLVLLLTLTACGGGGEEALPTVVPTLAGRLDTEAASPRIAGTPDARIPPTWTPGSQPVAPTRLTPLPDAGGEETTGATGLDGNVYVVQAGDTLAEIAADFGVDLELLVEINEIENIDVIEVGQELIIPVE